MKTEGQLKKTMDFEVNAKKKVNAKKIFEYLWGIPSKHWCAKLPFQH